MNRRAFLAGAGGASLAAAAGCSAILGSDDGDAAAFRPIGAWAVAPDASPTRPYNYEVASIAPRAALDAVDGLGKADLSPGVPSNSLAWDALPATSIERTIELRARGAATPHSYAVFEGDFDPETIVAAMDDRPTFDRERVGSYREYDLHDTGPGFFFHGLRDGRAVEVDRYGYDDASRSTIEAVIDLGAGDRDRIEASHDGFAAVADRLTPAHWTVARLVDPGRETDVENGTFAGVTAAGVTVRIEDGRSRVRSLLAFRDSDASVAAAVGEYLETVRVEETVASADAESHGRVLEIRLTLTYPAPFVRP